YVIKPKPMQQVQDSSKHGNFYNKQELKKFLAAAKDKGLKKYTLFRLLAYSGMRVGECLALTWHDLDFKNNTIATKKTLPTTEQGIEITTAKNKAATRERSLDNESMHISKSWQRGQRKQRLIVGTNAMDSKQLIGSNDKDDSRSKSPRRRYLKQI